MQVNKPIALVDDITKTRHINDAPDPDFEKLVRNLEDFFSVLRSLYCIHEINDNHNDNRR